MHRQSATALREAFVRGEVSATEISKHFLKRIEQYNGELGAFLSVFSDRTRERAAALDAKRARGEPLGKLAAVPIAIKDNIHLEGEITTCASRFLEPYRAPFSATATRLLEDEDAIILGKTNMDEFAMGSSNENSAMGACSNPWALDSIPGGSSGGSAAVVAAQLVPLALGSDTGGSIRQPASLCGVHGFKPTYGRVSRYGLVAFGSSLDQIGPFARYIEDLALTMEVIGTHCRRDSTSLSLPSEEIVSKLRDNLAGTTVGVPTRFLADLPSESRSLFETSLELLKQLGASVIEVDLDILRYSIAIYYILATAEASTNLARFDGIRYGRRSARAQTLDQVYDYSKQEGFGPEVKRRIMLGTYVLSAGYQDAYYKKAQKVRTLMIEKYREAFRQCDLIALPTTSGPAFPRGSVQEPLQMYLQDLYTIGPNLAGLPAISTPCGFLDSKPMGMQFVGPQKADGCVVAAAHAFAKAAKLEQKSPERYAE